MPPAGWGLSVATLNEWPNAFNAFSRVIQQSGKIIQQHSNIAFDLIQRDSLAASPIHPAGWIA